MPVKIEDTSLTPDAHVEKKELRCAVKASIESLSPEHRLVIVLRDIQGFSYEEIAGILNCPEGTVKSKINRARQALRGILKDRKELYEEVYVKHYRKEGWK